MDHTYLNVWCNLIFKMFALKRYDGVLDINWKVTMWHGITKRSLFGTKGIETTDIKFLASLNAMISQILLCVILHLALTKFSKTHAVIFFSFTKFQVKHDFSRKTVPIFFVFKKNYIDIYYKITLYYTILITYIYYWHLDW